MTEEENPPQWRHAATKVCGTNPRALGTNPRVKARNRWALRNWKRKRKKGREK
jgi:hypothetical protein